MMERKDVTILAPTAPAKVGTPQAPPSNPERDGMREALETAFTSVPKFDPDHPREDPNELLARTGGQMTDPARMNHNCPFCKKTMRWELFIAHITPCITKWGSLHKRNFPGVALEPDRIEAPKTIGTPTAEAANG